MRTRILQTAYVVITVGAVYLWTFGLAALARWVVGLSFVVFVGCGDNLAPYCTSHVDYLGPDVPCVGDPNGVCVALDGEDMCMPRCATGVHPRCPDGEVWYTLATDTRHVCYCAPIP